MKGFIEVSYGDQSILISTSAIVYVQPSDECTVIRMLGIWQDGRPITLTIEESYSNVLKKMSDAVI